MCRGGSSDSPRAAFGGCSHVWHLRVHMTLPVISPRGEITSPSGDPLSVVCLRQTRKPAVSGGRPMAAPTVCIYGFIINPNAVGASIARPVISPRGEITIAGGNSNNGYRLRRSGNSMNFRREGRDPPLQSDPTLYLCAGAWAGTIRRGRGVLICIPHSALYKNFPPGGCYFPGFAVE